MQNLALNIKKKQDYKYYKKQLTIYENTQIRVKGFNHNTVETILFQPSSTTLGFRNYPFYETRENLKIYSWLIITKVGLAVSGFKLLQYLYQEYGKEILRYIKF